MSTKRKLKPLLLSVAQLSQLYGLSESLIYSWVDEGADCFRCGRSGRKGTIRFTEAQAVKLMEHRSRGEGFDAHAFSEAIRAELED